MLSDSHTGGQSAHRGSVAASGPEKYDYIDALRGYAILLVIVVHAGAAFPELPWPLKRFTNLGWYGVQLFFVVSSMTLAMSWHSRQSDARLRSVRFLVRRFFRIAPMYYLATIYYLLVRPPGDSFSLSQLVTSSTFTHGWSPGTIPTSDNSWVVVPGSWSVAAEFGFYLLFPLLIGIASTPWRAVIAVAASLVVAHFANEIAFAYYLDSYGFTATDQFLFFWLPNQLPVFLSGLVLYHLIARRRATMDQSVAVRFLRRHANPIIAVVAVAVLSVPFLSIPRLPFTGFPYIPIHVLVAWGFCVAIGVLAVVGRHPLVNPAVVWMGRVSFSAYLIHFTVIPTLARLAPGVFSTSATGVPAIFHFALLLSAAVALTFLVSLVTYKVVELPMIAYSKQLSSRLWVRSNTERRA